MVWKVIAKQKTQDETIREFTVYSDTEEGARQKIETLNITAPYLLPCSLEIIRVEQVEVQEV